MDNVSLNNRISELELEIEDLKSAVAFNKQDNIKLRESERKYRFIVENVGEGIGFVNISEEFVVVNPAAERIFGVDRGQLQGRNLKEFMSEEQYRLILNQTQKRKKGESSIYEFELIRPDREVRNVIVTAVPKFDDDHVFVGTNGIFRDISEAKQAEKVLRESEERFRLMIKNSNDMLILINKEGKQVFVSDAVERVTGYAVEETSVSFTNFIHPDDLDDLLVQWDKVLGNKDMIIHAQYRHKHKSMGYIWLEAVAQNFLDNPAINAVIVNVRDVSFNKESEILLKENEKQLVQLNSDKDLFISILSHDLRSPFNNLLGLSEVLKENIQDYSIEDIRKLAGDINKSALNTYNLLEDILVWARAQMGKIPFKPMKIKVAEIFSNVTDTLNSVATTKNITVNYSAADNLVVYADIDMLKSVLRNLVSNSIKFTNKGGTINIDAELNHKNVIISVTDNGIGINPLNLSKLFNITEVISTNGTENEKGSGLGLLLCKDFVEKHGGKIRAESEEGKGSSFQFSLPVSGISDEESS